MKKILLLSIFLGISILNYAFEKDIMITTNPSNAEIYVDGVFVAKGHYEFKIHEARLFTVTIKKEGYETVVKKYKYRTYGSDDFIDYDRWGDINIYVELQKKGGSAPTTVESASSINKLQLLTSVETLKSEQLLTSDEYLLLKDKLLSEKEDLTYIARIQELREVYKLVKVGFIKREDFIVTKNFILVNFFSKGNFPSDKLKEIKSKSTTGYYSTEEITKLKKQLINGYK